MEFNTPYNRKKSAPEINPGPRIIEVSSFISKEQRIRDVLLAGERLIAARQDMYDYPDPDTDPETMEIDPTRKGFDLADATMTQRLLAQKARLKAQHKRKLQEAHDAIKEKPLEKPVEDK